jgi:hypothetical protein
MPERHDWVWHETGERRDTLGEDTHFALRTLTAFRLSRAVWLAARLRLADLVDGPSTVAELASKSETDPDALGRLLRALAAFGVFQLEPDGRFAHTPASQLLRSDHPRSQRAWLECLLGGEMFDAWATIESAVRTGQPSFNSVHGMTWVEYYREHEPAAALFADAMSATTRAFEDALLAADPFPSFACAVDVGASQGSLLRRLLERNPHARGVLFDLPEVIERWRAERPDDLGGRLQAVAGDFFEHLPAGGDLYVLKFILHDWDDERAVAILSNALRAVADGGRLAIVETVLPDTPAEHPGYLFDLNMLAITGGRERTMQDFTDLLDRAGWRIERIVATESPLSVILAAGA